MSKLSNFPVLKQFWSYFREQKILKQHHRVSIYWSPLIQKYFDGEIEKFHFKPKVDLGDAQVIWQYWGQGVDPDKLPEVVQMCFESVDHYRGDYTVIRLDDRSIEDYIDLPDFVKIKLENQTFTKTFFSDLLRVLLLKTYGGVWLDATVLMTNQLEKKYIDMDYFLFQRDEKAKMQSFWENSYAFYWNWHRDFKVKMLSSIFYAKKESKVVETLVDLMLYYWKNETELLDYFVFQILYQELIEGKMKQDKCLSVDDTLPHLLQTKFNGMLHEISYESILSQTNTHKMSYFDENGLQRMKNFLNH